MLHCSVFMPLECCGNQVIAHATYRQNRDDVWNGILQPLFCTLENVGICVHRYSLHKSDISGMTLSTLKKKNYIWRLMDEWI